MSFETKKALGTSMVAECLCLTQGVKFLSIIAMWIYCKSFIILVYLIVNYTRTYHSMTTIKPGILVKLRPNIEFMRVGISNVDTTIPAPEDNNLDMSPKTWTLKRLSTLIKMLNHTKVRCFTLCRNKIFLIFYSNLPKIIH